MSSRCPPRESEKLKHDYGAVQLEGESGEESLTIRTTAGRTNTITRQQLCEIIEARQQEILEFARKAIEQHPYGQMVAAGLILTGGGAQLTNLAELGEEILGMPVRLGTPQNVITSEETANNLAFATAIGLLRFSLDKKDQEDCILGEVPSNGGGGFKEKLTRFFVSFFLRDGT